MASLPPSICADVSQNTQIGSLVPLTATVHDLPHHLHQIETLCKSLERLDMQNMEDDQAREFRDLMESVVPVEALSIYCNSRDAENSENEPAQSESRTYGDYFRDPRKIWTDLPLPALLHLANTAATTYVSIMSHEKFKKRLVSNRMKKWKAANSQRATEGQTTTEQPPPTQSLLDQSKERLEIVAETFGLKSAASTGGASVGKAPSEGLQTGE